MTEPIISVKELFHQYGDFTAVDGISFEVSEGEIFSFLGPNGAGKSTAINVLITLLPLQQGSATVAGFDVVKDPEQVRESIGIVFQDVTLDRDMTCREILEFHGNLYKMPNAERKDRIEELLALVQLENKQNTRTKNLSGGMKRRLEIARGLMTRPRVLFLDEPTIGLDPRQVAEIREFIKSLAGERTIILSTHILPEVSMTCERIIIIHEGQIAAVDTPDNLMKKLQKTSKTVALIKGPAGGIREKLQMLPGVITIEDKGESSPGVCCFEVEAAKESEISGELARLVYLNNWKLVEMRTEKMSLEKIFIELTREEGAS